MELKLDKLKDRTEYLEKRHNRPSTAFFNTFEMCIARYEWASESCKYPIEFDYLTNLYLTHANQYGQATSDDVYELVNGEFQGNPKISGSVVGSLKKRGLIQSIGRIRSRIPIKHGRNIDIWALTDKGKELFPLEVKV